MSSIKIEEVKEYISAYDAKDEDIQELIDVAQIYLDTMVGEGYKNNTKKLKLASLVLKKLISDMYDNRSTTVDGSLKQDRVVTSILDSLANEGDEL